MLSLGFWVFFRQESRLDRCITWGNARADATTTPGLRFLPSGTLLGLSRLGAVAIFDPLIAPLFGGTHVRSPLGAPKACCRLSPGYIFARGRAWIAGLYGGKHARTPSGASKTNSRLNFGYILARSRDLASAPWSFSAPDRCSIWGNARADVLGRCISVLSRTSG